MKHPHTYSFGNGPPESIGRFLTIYKHRKEAGSIGLKKFVTIAGGLALFLSGVVLLAFPGPGLLLIVAGGTMMAQYSYYVAKGLDKAEAAARRTLHRGARIWDHADTTLRTLIVTAAVVVAMTPMILGLRYFF